MQYNFNMYNNTCGRPVKYIKLDIFVVAHGLYLKIKTIMIFWIIDNHIHKSLLPVNLEEVFTVVLYQ